MRLPTCSVSTSTLASRRDWPSDHDFMLVPGLYLDAAVGVLHGDDGLAFDGKMSFGPTGLSARGRGQQQSAAMAAPAAETQFAEIVRAFIGPPK